MCPLATFMFMTNSTLLWWTLDSVLLLVVIKLKALKQWFLTEGRAPSGRRQEISKGARALTCSTTWKGFERKCVSS